MTTLVTTKPKEAIKCCWCGIQLEGEFYRCKIHKNLFCNDCAKDNGKRALKKHEAPSCTRKYYLGEFFVNDAKKAQNSNDNCILEKFDKIEHIPPNV